MPASGEDLGGRQFIWKCSHLKDPQAAPAQPTHMADEILRPEEWDAGLSQGPKAHGGQNWGENL